MKYCIIKNKEAFGKIKLANKVLLYQKAKERDGDYGFLHDEFAKQWFVTQKGRAMFKTYDLEFNSNDGFVRIQNELISGAIAKQLGLDVAEYVPAQYKIFEGLATYDYQKENEVVISGSKFLTMGNCKQLSNLQEFLSCAKNINNQGKYKIDLQKMESDLFKMIVFDSLTFQEDRGLQNILFLLNQKDKTIKVAPITDNEYAFGGFQENVSFDEKGVERQSFLSSHSRNVLFTIKPMEYYGVKNRYLQNVKDIVEYVSKNEELKKFLVMALNKLDYKKAIESINSTSNTIPNGYELVLLEYEKLAKDVYKKAIQKFKSQEMGLNWDEKIYHQKQR